MPCRDWEDGGNNRGLYFEVMKFVIQFLIIIGFSFVGEFSWDIISGSLVKYVVVTFVTTFVVMGVSGLVTQVVIRRGKSK